MSLDWNVAKVKNNAAWEVATHTDRMAGIEEGKEYLTPIADALIWLTMAIDLGAITKENSAEFFRRVQLWQLAFGTSLIRYPADGGEPERLFITPEDVQRHIGLYTNVHNKTAKQFEEKLKTRLLHQLQEKAKRAQREYSEKLIAEVSAKK